MTVYENYNVIPFKFCIQIFTVQIEKVWKTYNQNKTNYKKRRLCLPVFNGEDVI